MDQKVRLVLDDYFDWDKVYTEESALLKDAQLLLDILGAYVIRKEARTLKGFPDILICYRGRFIGIELKDNEGKLSPHQEKQIIKIRNAGGIAAGCRTLRDILVLILYSEN